jgi:hypothetical protein
MTAEDLAAMRHLRSVVEAIAANENTSRTEKKEQMDGFDELLAEVEQRLHYNENRQPMLNVDPLALSTPKKSMKKNVRATGNAGVSNTKKKKKQGWLKSMIHGKQDNSQANVSNQKRQSKRMGGVLETLLEEANDTRDDINDRERDITARDETDSIIELRMQNSEAFLASVCSLRSLGTFEKDFINNIIADQAANGDMISVSTFEQDYMAKMNNNVTHPTQVFVNHTDLMDDLTVDTLLSETTFENDARAIMNGDVNTLKLKLPTQITTSGQHHEFINDGGCDQHNGNEFLNETTLRNVGSAPTTFAAFTEVDVINDAISGDSLLSVSTYEKDMAALTALADKIGRVPSTQPRVVMTNGSERSCSTFERDVAFRSSVQAPLWTPVADAPSNISESTFMTDYGMRFADPQSIVNSRALQKIEPFLPDGLGTTNAPSDRPSQQIEPMSPLPSPKTEPNSPESKPILKNDLAESQCVDLNLNPGWFTGLKDGEQKRNSAGGGKGAVYVLQPASLERNSSLLSAAARQADVKVQAMDASKRISNITPLEVQLVSYLATQGGSLDTIAGAKSKEQEGSFWGRFLCQVENCVDSFSWKKKTSNQQL